MTTIFDWLAAVLFGAIAVLFLHRSLGAARKRDNMLLYLPPAVLCALSNWLGNAGHVWAAIALLSAGVAYFLCILRPGRRPL